MYLSKLDVTENLVNETVDYVVKNINQYFDANKEIVDFCVCKGCLLDITALTLNTVKGGYRLLGRHAHKELEQVSKINEEILFAIAEAILLVQKRPHHE